MDRGLSLWSSRLFLVVLFLYNQSSLCIDCHIYGLQVWNIKTGRRITVISTLFSAKA